MRQLLNHSVGRLGDCVAGYWHGDEALSDYVGGLPTMPQLRSLRSTFQYNNTVIGVAGRIIEAVTGATYEDASQTPSSRGLDLEGPHITCLEIAHVDGFRALAARPARVRVPRVTLMELGRAAVRRNRVG